MRKIKQSPTQRNKTNKTTQKRQSNTQKRQSNTQKRQSNTQKRQSNTQKRQNNTHILKNEKEKSSTTTSERPTFLLYAALLHASCK